MESAAPSEKKVLTIDLKGISGKRFHKKKVIIIAVTAIMIFGVIASGSFYYFRPSSSNSNAQNYEANAQDNDNVSVAAIKPTPTPDLYVNPFNGLPMTKEQYEGLKNRPMAIMMDNSKPARLVQENLNRSDMVYEALVEGGWTRFMGVYYSDQSNFRVMPVRSVRKVFLDNFEEYNDMLLYHVGGAFTPEQPKTNAIQKIFDDKVKSIYFYKYNFTPTFVEKYDPSCMNKGDIPGYSCKYQMTDILWNKATEVGFQAEKWEPQRKYDWKWQFDKTNFNKSDKAATSVKYKFTANAGYDADWTYDAAKNKYLRKIAGQKLMDHASNDQVWANTIVVQKAKTVLNVDDKLRSIVETVGKGDAYIFMEGKASEVEWRKETAASRTRYYNKEDGKEFVFNPGKIWVSVTRDVEQITYN